MGLWGTILLLCRFEGRKRQSIKEETTWNDGLLLQSGQILRQLEMSSGSIR